MNPNTHKLLLKAILLIEEIADQSSKLSIQALARHLDLSYASTYRIVHTFLHCDWLHLAEDGSLRISPNLSGRLDRDTKQNLLVERAKPIVDALVRRTGLTAKLCTRNEDHAVSLYRSLSERPTAVSTQVGSCFHLAGGSSGATILSSLPDEEIEPLLKSAPPRYWQLQSRADVAAKIEEARKTGVCFDNGQFHPDLYTASVPLRDLRGRIVAVITLMGFPSDFTLENRDRFRRLMLEAADAFQKISRQKEVEARRMAEAG